MSNMYHGSTYLVTGAAGFVGSHFVEELVRREANVVAIVRSLEKSRIENLDRVKDRIELVRLDLCSDDLRPVLARTEFDAVFHLAANANLQRSVQDPRTDLESNILGTFNVLEAVRVASPETKVILGSSAYVYGEGVGKPIEEDDPKVPKAPIGVSKLAAEHYGRLHAELYGLRTASARMFSVFGPRLRTQVVFDLMSKLVENSDELHIQGDGNQVRDMNYVTNVVDAILLIASRGLLAGESYNVGSGEPVSIKDVAGLICEGMAVAPRFVFSGSVRAGETRRWEADNSRLRELGYQSNVGLREGIHRTIQWFQEGRAEG